MESDVKEQPARRTQEGLGKEGGVVEIPWPEESERSPRSERPDAPAYWTKDEQPKAKKGGQREAPPQSTPGHAEQTRFWWPAGLIITGLIVLAVIGGLLWWAFKPAETKVTYTTAKAEIATVTITAHANGRLAAREPFEVVAPAGGRLENAVAKSGDHVRQGQILARLNSESARADMINESTEVTASQAELARSDADVAEARAALARARSSTTAGAVDGAEARLARAVVRGDEARAALGAARTRLAAARARVDGLLIRAPFDGIVLKNNVDTAEPGRIARGQSLFTLVRDLSALDLDADFPENAVGPLHVGQVAMFTVTAFPHRNFSARLNAIGTWPKTVHKEGDKDITLYPGTLTAANPDGSLRPGMSADVAVILAQARNVLTVPDSALVFRPAAGVEAKFPSARAAYPPPVQPGTSAPSKSTPSLGSTTAPAASWSTVTLSSEPRPGRVWVLDGDTPKPRDIMVGVSDGNITQIVSGELRPGDTVITNAIVQAGKARS